MKDRESKPDVLACAIHKVKLATVVIHDLGNRWVAPQLVDRQGKLLRKVEIGFSGEV